MLESAIAEQDEDRGEHVVPERARRPVALAGTVASGCPRAANATTTKSAATARASGTRRRGSCPSVSRGCGTGIRTPTSCSRDRRPTIRRSRNGSAAQCSRARAPQISSRYIGTRRRSVSVSMCATTSTYGSRPEPRELRLQQPVHLEEPGRVVHQDLDQDRPLLAVGDRRRPRSRPPRASASRRGRARTGSRERPFAMSSASATRRMPASIVSGCAVGAVADDRLQHLRDDHRPVGLVVDARRAARAASARRGRARSPRGRAGGSTCRCSA